MAIDPQHPPGGPRSRKPSLPAKHRRLRLMPGQIIPGTSWRIIRWLGEGGMGVVYEARHIEINRRAAIKMVGTLADDPGAVADFRREASASAQIGSPNIADVFDFAVLNDGRLMMAMEFVPGRSLHDIQVDEHQLSPSRLIGLFRQVCKGLQAAHEAGLVHRDIKPENIMVGEIAGRQDTVKIVDFGIATILGERSARNAGTPYYMPPEGSRNGAIDGRYDIYSVGCVMFEMLTGDPPFVDRSLERVLQMHMYEPVPEFVDAGKVPRKLVEVIRRCLAKEPIDRYASMNELEAALCEAQIEGKLRTSWDDLVLPAIDPERRAKLQAKMPTRALQRGVSGWWMPVLLVCGVLVGGLFAWPMSRADDPALAQSLATDSTEVEGLVARVHQSAALAYYVYPPVDDPQADTAYKVLIQLEAFDHEAALLAADLLRTELASTLVRLGDDLWAEPGGEPFALDFYVQAMMFDPAIEPARTRAAMSLGELLALRRKAGAGDFTESELIAVEPLSALAEPDVAVKQAKLQSIQARRSDKRRAGSTAQLDTLIGIESSTVLPGVDDGALADSEFGVDASVELVAAKGSKGAADGLVAQANAARKAARLLDAETLYHKALHVEQHRVDALTGLGRVYFEQAKYSKAVTYYSMAVRRSGRDAKLRIALGDAYLKTLDYDQAREQYVKAKALGSRKATERIARIEQ